MKNTNLSEMNNDAARQDEMMLGSTFWVCDKDGGKETAIGSVENDFAGIFGSPSSSRSQYVMRDESESFIVV